MKQFMFYGFADTQPPRVESCDSPPLFMIPANIHAVDITWNAPVFSDNSGLDIKVKTLESNNHICACSGCAKYFNFD